MHYLQDLQRFRPKILYNLAPEEISKDVSQPYFVKIPVRFTDYSPDKKADSPTRKKNFKHAKSKMNVMDLKSSLVRGKDEEEYLTKSPRSRTIIASEKNSPTAKENNTTTATTRVKAKPVEFIPHSIKNVGLWDTGCLTCGNINVITKYHGERHICVSCRKFIKTMNGDKAYIYIDRDGELKTQGLKVVKEDGREKKVLYDVPSDSLKIFEYRCYVTFSDKDELIVLLHDEQKSLIPRRLFEKKRNLMMKESA